MASGTRPPRQGRAPAGVTVRSIAVPGVEGSFLTSGLPQGTSGTWVNSTPLTPGPVSVTVTTSGAVKTFSVLPASAPSPPAYLDPIVCAVTAATPATPSASFTVDPRVSYDSNAKAWRLSVTIANAGRVSAVQPELTVGTAAPRSKTEKPLVQARGQSLKTPGSHAQSPADIARAVDAREHWNDQAEARGHVPPRRRERRHQVHQPLAEEVTPPRRHL